MQNERNLIISHKVYVTLLETFNNTTGNNSSGNLHAPGAFFENDTLSSNLTLNPNSPEDYFNAPTTSIHSDDNSLNPRSKFSDVTSQNLQQHSTPQTPVDHTHLPEEDEILEVNRSLSSQYNASQSTLYSDVSTQALNGRGTMGESLEGSYDLQFITEYLSDDTLNSAIYSTDLSIEIFQKAGNYYSGWPQFELGNPFITFRNQAKFENISVELLWANYSNQIEGLRSCPFLKGIHKQFRIDSGHVLMLVYLRNALLFTQDKIAHIILGYESHYQELYVDLLKTSVVHLEQSLSIFTAPSAPVLPCKYSVFAEYDPNRLNTPRNLNDFYSSIVYHTKFAMGLRECELNLRSSVITRSEDYIKKLYQKITIELLLIMTALLIVPTILYSFIKVSKWITVYVSQLEERNSALAEKTAELDKEKSLTEKLLYEVSKELQTILLSRSYWNLHF